MAEITTNLQGIVQPILTSLMTLNTTWRFSVSVQGLWVRRMRILIAHNALLNGQSVQQLFTFLFAKQQALTP